MIKLIAMLCIGLGIVGCFYAAFFSAIKTMDLVSKKTDSKVLETLACALSLIVIFGGGIFLFVLIGHKILGEPLVLKGMVSWPQFP